MESTCSSETSVDSQRTTRRYIPENRTIHNNAVKTLYPTRFNICPLRLIDKVECVFLKTRTDAVIESSALRINIVVM
jgi:hypothetical protein